MDKQKLFDSFIEVMSKFAQIRAVVALRDGFIMTTPFYYLWFSIFVDCKLTNSWIWRIYGIHIW